MNGSLDKIKEILETLPPDQCCRILTSTVDDSVPLSIALEQKNIKISNYLFQLSSRQEHHERSDSWNKGVHPLINAMKSGFIDMIYLISRNLWDINDCISGPYTPLIQAVFSKDIRCVRLILLLGGNINKPCLNGVSPLIISIFDSKICSFLLSQNADINHQDSYGDTALHIATSEKQIETVRILIDSDADVRIRNNDGLMPLMIASVNISHQCVLDLCELNDYSQIEKIEALEVLSACLVGYGSPDISYWFRALEMRNPRFPKIRNFPTENILDFSREFTKKKELESLQADQLKLAFQGILVIERILGRNNFVYLRQLLQTTLIAKDENKMEKVQQLTDYILQYCQEASAYIICSCSNFFKILFTEIFLNGSPENIFENGAFDLFKIIARATAEMWFLVKDKFYQTPFTEHIQYSELADTFLYITSRIGNMNLPEQYEGKFSEVVVQLVREDPRFIRNRSLLHRVINLTMTEAWASVKLIRLLLESGADVNSKDYFRRTPLLYTIVYGPDDCVQKIVELLIEYKCHLDYRDHEGFSPVDLPRWASISVFPRSPRSLQCLGVEVILDNQIEYEGVLSEEQRIFIDLHR